MVRKAVRRYNLYMFDDPSNDLALRQADQARGDLYAIQDELDFIKAQLARLPTRRDLARSALMGTLTGSCLTIALIELFSRWH
jgi:hypothetical protein